MAQSQLIPFMELFATMSCHCRFVRDLSENGKEILSMNEVVSYMLRFYILHNVMIKVTPFPFPDHMHL